MSRIGMLSWILVSAGLLLPGASKAVSNGNTSLFETLTDQSNIQTLHYQGDTSEGNPTQVTDFLRTDSLDFRSFLENEAISWLHCKLGEAYAKIAVFKLTDGRNASVWLLFDDESYQYFSRSMVTVRRPGSQTDSYADSTVIDELNSNVRNYHEVGSLDSDLTDGPRRPLNDKDFH